MAKTIGEESLSRLLCTFITHFVREPIFYPCLGCIIDIECHFIEKYPRTKNYVEKFADYLIHFFWK